MWPHLIPMESWCVYTTWGCIHTSYIFSNHLVSERFLNGSPYKYDPHCGHTFASGIKIWINLNLHTWGCFHTGVNFQADRYSGGKKIFYVYSCAKLKPLLWSHHTPKMMILTNFKFTLLDDASKQVTFFLANYFVRRSLTFSLY